MSDKKIQILEDVREVLDLVKKKPDGSYAVPGKLAELTSRKEFSDLNNNKKVALLINQPTDMLLALAQASAFPPWVVPATFSERGDYLGLQSFFDVVQDYKPEGGLLTWSLWRLEDLGATSAPHPDCIKLLVKKGADPNYRYNGYDANDSLLSKAIRLSASDECIIALIQMGANVDAAYEDLRKLDLTKKPEVQRHFIGKSFFEMADTHTLVMHKHLREGAGVLSLKRIFDFEAGRVTETYGNQQPVGYSIDECNPDLVTRVKEKLVEKGGDPLDVRVVKRAETGNKILPMPGQSAA